MNVTLTLNEISVEQANKILALVKEDGKNASQTVQPEPPAYQAPVNNGTAFNALPVTAPPPQTVAAAEFQQTVPAAAPTAAPAYTIEQFQTALTPLLDAGKVAQVQQLVQSFGVNTLMDIPLQRYGEFANGLRQLGGVL